MSSFEPPLVVQPSRPATKRGPDLGQQLAVFVDRIARGAQPADAARLAGYPDPEATAIDLLRLPEVRKALASTIEGRLLSEHAPLALKVAADILNDANAPLSIKGKMAVAILDRVKAKQDGPEGAGGGLSAMSQGDLARLVQQLEASGAVVVPRDVTPRPLP